MSGYTSTKKKLTKTQRKVINRNLKQSLGDKWLPVAEFRKAKAEKLKRIEEEKSRLPESVEQNEPLVKKCDFKLVKGQIHPEVFRQLNLDAKIILFRRSLCNHNNNPKTCLTCKDLWKTNYKIPRTNVQRDIDYRKVL